MQEINGIIAIPQSNISHSPFPLSSFCPNILSYPGLNLPCQTDIDPGGLDCTSPSSSTAAASATGEAGDDNIEEADDAGDDGLEDGADAVNDCHQAGADCLKDGFDL